MLLRQALINGEFRWDGLGCEDGPGCTILIRILTEDGDVGIFIVNEIIPTINRLAEKNNVETLDLHSAIDDMKLMLTDGIHPNEKGAAVIARKVFEKM